MNRRTLVRGAVLAPVAAALPAVAEASPADTLVDKWLRVGEALYKYAADIGLSKDDVDLWFRSHVYSGEALSIFKRSVAATGERTDDALLRIMRTLNASFEVPPTA